MHYLAIPGGIEIWWILVAVLLLFGAKKLPELARAMGTSITQFKRGLKETDEDKESGRLTGGDTGGEGPNAGPPDGEGEKKSA